MRRRLKRAHGGTNPSSLYKIPHVAGKVRAKGATPAGASDTGANGDSSDSAKDTQDPRDPGPPEPDEGCGTEAAPPARADTRATSARAEGPSGQGPRRWEDRWSPRCVHESARHSPAPGARPPRTHSWHDPGRDPARECFRHAHHRSAGPAGLQIQPNADAEGIARDDPCPTDAQATPSPASPVIAAESVARGIALGVSAGQPEEMDGVENEDAQGTADRPPCADEGRVAQEKAGEERAAEEPGAEASARAPAAAVRLGGSTQHVQGPTNTLARDCFFVLPSPELTPTSPPQSPPCTSQSLFSPPQDGTTVHRFLSSSELRDLSSLLCATPRSFQHPHSPLYRISPIPQDGTTVHRFLSNSRLRDFFFDGTTVHRFLSNAKLREFFSVLTISFDKNGLEYVTTVQGKRYPFYGTQWHPEKNAYEWGLDHIPHGAHAIAVGQAAANFFVNEARRSTHHPASDESTNDMLLYNYAPVFAGKNGHGYFEQSYVFRKKVGFDFARTTK
ncbi:unnamed protein product [Closterium sp. Yama58-4]|nr:unnamed protein product [Closterium sp. Yama58-4]